MHPHTMRRRRRICSGRVAALLCWAALAAGAASPARGAAVQPNDPAVVSGLPRPIPLSLLLGNAKYRNPQLSSDGRFLALIKPDPSNGVNNLFIRRLPASEAEWARVQPGVPLLEQQGGAAADVQVTFDAKRGVFGYGWSEDGSALFYLQDRDGDENSHLFMVPLSAIMRGGGGGSSGSGSSSSGGSSASSRAGGSSTDSSDAHSSGAHSSASSSRPAAIDLTPWPGVKVQGIITNERFPNRVYFTMNRRDARVFDLYQLDVDSRAVQLHAVNPGDVGQWITDYDFDIRAVDAYDPRDGSTYVLIDNSRPAAASGAGSAANSSSRGGAAVQEERGTSSSSGSSSSSSSGSGGGGSSSSSRGGIRRGMPLAELFAQAAAGNWTAADWVAASATRANVSAWRLLVRWPMQEESAVFRFNRAGDALYGLSSEGRDTAAFVLISTAPGARTLRRIADSPHANAGAAIFHPVTWEPQLVSFDYLKPNWTLLDLALAPDWAQLTAFRPDAVPTITSRSYDSAAWLVQYGADNATTGSYLYRPGAPGPPQLLFETQPELKAHRLASMHPVVFAACDGLRIPAYLTLPVRPGVPAVLPACVAGDVPDATPAARAAAAASPLACPLGLKLPLVLLVHGGPWSRDTWGVDSVVQLLANRGYAVLQVNYRGSTGYGKRFTNAGNGQWGVGAMQHDLTDAVRWAIEKGVAHPRRVCIMGGSYGGYAALAGLTFTPELYACGLDLVGISNVGTFMKSIPPYWEPMLQDFISRVGDVASNDTLNRAISPLFHVQRVRAPLLIGQGANDPRVPQAESDQMFKAMKARGLDVTYVLYPDEGHGLVRPDNRLDFYSRVEQFLARHLGGRAQPPPALPGSTARVVAAVA